MIEEQKQMNEDKYNLTIHKIYRNLLDQEDYLDNIEEVSRNIYEFQKSLEK